MDKRIISAGKKIKDQLKGAIKTEDKEFKGLLKEDKKLDAKRDKLESEVKKRNRQVLRSRAPKCRYVHA